MKLYFLFFLLIISSNSFSQSTLSGQVIAKDSNNPIPYAEVLLIKDGEFYKAGVADNLGNYSITAIEKGTYKLSLKYLGFETYTETILFSQVQNLQRRIIMTPTSEQLDEVTITGKKTSITFLPDKRVVNIGDDLIAIGAGTEDILRQIPSVDVDLSGNVSLRNSTNVIVMIDGKRSPLSSADIIAQIPSNLIDKIEVITNPSAKYDAEGISGIINIKTKKSKLRGGNLGLAMGYGEEGRANFTTNGNYRNNKVNLFINYSFRKTYFDSEFTTLRTDENSQLVQNGFSAFNDAKTNHVKIGADFFIDSTQTLTPSFIFNENRHAPFNRTKSVLTDTNGTNSIDFTSENKHLHMTREGNLNYRKEFNGSQHYFEVDVNLAIYPNEFDLDLVQNQSNNNGFTINDNQKSDNLISTFSADYYFKVNEKSTYEFGTKYEYRNLDNFQDRTIISNSINSQTINSFIYKDHVFAVYGIYEHRFEKFSIKPGFRLEQYNINLGNDASLDFDDSYLNLFPSFSASYNLEKTSFTTSYTRRISRPNAFVLNPFLIEQGNFQRRQGNPFLRPSFADIIELNFNQRFKKNNLNISLFYTKNEDIRQSIFRRDGDFVIGSFENVGSSKSYGLETFLRLNIFKWWDTNFSFNYYFSKFNVNSFPNNTTFSQRYFVRNSFKLPKDWSAQLNVNINPRRQTLQQTVETNYRLDLSISKRLFEGKGQATLRLNDIFDTQEFEFNRGVANFNQTTTRKPLSRYLYFTYRHRFSFGKKDYQNRKRKQRNYSDGNVN